MITGGTNPSSSRKIYFTENGFINTFPLDTNWQGSGGGRADLMNSTWNDPTVGPLWELGNNRRNLLRHRGLIKQRYLNSPDDRGLSIISTPTTLPIAARDRLLGPIIDLNGGINFGVTSIYPDSEGRTSPVTQVSGAQIDSSSAVHGRGQGTRAGRLTRGIFARPRQPTRTQVDGSLDRAAFLDRAASYPSHHRGLGGTPAQRGRVLEEMLPDPNPAAI